jgi:hypothetical protein
MLARTEKTGTEQAKQISKSKLNKLFDAGKRTKRETHEISGGFGSQVKDAVENDNLDRVAFSIARRLDSLSDEKLYSTLPALMYYIEQRGLDERAKNAPPLIADEEGEEGGEEE